MIESDTFWKMVRYTQEEYLDMLQIYHECGSNAKEAVKQYKRTFPQRQRKPEAINFLRTINRIRRTGSVHVIYFSIFIIK